MLRIALAVGLLALTAHAQQWPSKTTFSSSGNGSSDHLTAELFWLQTNTTGVHVDKVKQQFASVGFEIAANTPEQFAAFQQKGERALEAIDRDAQDHR